VAPAENNIHRIMKKARYIIILYVFLQTLYLPSNAFAHTDVTPLEAKDLIDNNKNLTVIDVREEANEYCKLGHIPGARNYPLNSGVLEEKYQELSLEDEFLVVCQSGHGSNTAAEFLDANGFQHVYDMVGGMSVWEWETVGCIDTDLDGLNDDLDNCPEISNPDQKDTDKNGVGDACENNNTLCPAEILYGESSEEALLLRDFRDTVLDKTSEGRRIIRLYYAVSPMFVTMMEKDKKVKNRIKTAVDELLPGLRKKMHQN